jgi:hypothetical protein
MAPNVADSELSPRILIAIGLGMAATLAPGLLLKGLLLAGSTGLLATVATGFCPVNAALGADGDTNKAHWRTLKVYRVEP